MAVCVCGGGGGITACNLQVVIPGTLTTVMPIALAGSDGLASRFVPCVSMDTQKSSASKTKNPRNPRILLFHTKCNTRIACWNVRSIGTLSDQSEKLQSVLRTMKEKRIELLSESRWTGQGVSKIRAHTILHSVSESQHVHGVAFVLSPLAQASWEAAGCVFDAVSERIVRIRVKLHLSFATIIAVYTPTNPTTSTSEAMSPSTEFYSLLQSVIASVPHKDMLIVLGDLNARIGQSSPHWKSIVGPFTTDDTNENGSLLLDFCASNNLFIANTWFQHKPIHLTTWYRNGDRSRAGHMLDYVLVNRNFRTSVLDTRVYRSTYLESDHELVVSTLRYKIRAKRR